MTPYLVLVLLILAVGMLLALSPRKARRAEGGPPEFDLADPDRWSKTMDWYWRSQ